jgi:hypothetical protein
MSHSPEPWTYKPYYPVPYDSDYIIQSGLNEVAVCHKNAQRDQNGLPFGDAARIVACVNAFRGFPTEAIGPFMEKIQEAMRLSDRLFTTTTSGGARDDVADLMAAAFWILRDHGMEWKEAT